MLDTRLLLQLPVIAIAFLACASPPTGDKLARNHMDGFAQSAITALEHNPNFPNDSDFAIAIVTSTDVPAAIMGETTFSGSQQLIDAFYDSVAGVVSKSAVRYRAQSRPIFASYCAAAGVQDPWELAIPAKQKAFAAIAEEHGQRIDYFLITRLTASKTVDGGAIEYRTIAELAPASGDVRQVARGEAESTIVIFTTPAGKMIGVVEGFVALVQWTGSVLQRLQNAANFQPSTSVTGALLPPH